MTALRKYARLESTGLWREGPEAQGREVYVLFRDASLVISDRAEAPLSHWALTAVDRLNPGEIPAIYGVDGDIGETLEIDDPTMIEAIETVRAALARQKPRPGRLRLAITAALTAAVVGLAVFWLPGALVRHTVQVVPEAKRLQIGRAISQQTAALTGPRCAAPSGVAAMGRLLRRLGGPAAPRVHVLPEGSFDTVLVPGPIVLVNARLVEAHDSPEILAGHILAAMASGTDPLADILHQSGAMATFRLLTTGDLPGEAIRAAAAAMTTRPPSPPEAEALLPFFLAAGVSSSAYAFHRDPSGESVLPLIEADPARGGQVAPLLSDSDWLRVLACGVN
ncbi:MAG: hypothetical protein JJU40_08135 [Rhodobacteraceae bacterium]|nr:hypothetical protein [Paracoccaceae bacterium]